MMTPGKPLHRNQRKLHLTVTLIPPPGVTCDDYQYNGSNASWYPENTCESDGLNGVRSDIEKIITIRLVADLGQP